MFGEMRAVLGITKAVDIIDHINSLPAAEQAAAHAAIQNIERTAMAKQTPQPGLDTLMQYLDARGVPKAICTRWEPDHARTGSRTNRMACRTAHICAHIGYRLG